MSLFNQNQPSGFPFFLPTLFGSGEDGDLTASNQSDVGYLGSFGIKQYRNLTIPAGVTWTVATGSASGAMILGVSGTLTLAGTITANGANGSNGLVDGGGAGGAAAGGGTGGVKTTVNGAGNSPTSGSAPLGHGGRQSLPNTYFSFGGGAGAFENNNAASASATGNVNWARRDTASSALYDSMFAMQSSQSFNKKVFFGFGGLTFVNTTGGSSGTVANVLPTTNDYGPWAQVSTGLFLPRSFISTAPSGEGGPVTGVVGQQAAGGGGGGGGGVTIVECNTLVLTAGYAWTSNGGNGGNGFSSNGTTAVAQGGMSGAGGIIIIICRNIVGSTAAITANAGTKGTGAGTAVATPPTMPAGGVYIVRV